MIKEDQGAILDLRAVSWGHETKCSIRPWIGSWPPKRTQMGTNGKI